MALTPTTLLIGAGLLGLGAYWFASGSEGPSPAVVAAAKAKGDAAGCAAGTADGKAGRAESLNPSDDADVAAAAKASGSPKDFLNAYDAGYARCYAANKAAPIGGGPPPGPAKPPDYTKPPPGATGAGKTTAGKAYSKGCHDGAVNGYTDGFKGNARNTVGSASAASASGNATAYRAAYADGYATAYMVGQAIGIAYFDKSTLPDDAGTRIAELTATCAAKFAAWYGDTYGTAGVAGINDAATGAFAVNRNVRNVSPTMSAAQERALACMETFKDILSSNGYTSIRNVIRNGDPIQLDFLIGRLNGGELMRGKLYTKRFYQAMHELQDCLKNLLSTLGGAPTHGVFPPTSAPIFTRGTNCPGGCSTEVSWFGLQRLRAPGRVAVRGAVTVAAPSGVGWPMDPRRSALDSPR